MRINRLAGGLKLRIAIPRLAAGPMLIVGQHVTDQANDKQQLAPTLAVVSPSPGEVDKVFGIIKEVLGFRRFLLRGREKVILEWELVSTSYNLKRLCILGMRLKGV